MIKIDGPGYKNSSVGLNHSLKGAVIACSALKKKYRKVIRTSANVLFICLKADKKILLIDLPREKTTLWLPL